MTDIERLAILETQMEALQKQHAQIMEKFDALISSFTKYKGFVGGIMFSVTSVGAALGFLLNYWFHKSQ